MTGCHEICGLQGAGYYFGISSIVWILRILDDLYMNSTEAMESMAAVKSMEPSDSLESMPSTEAIGLVGFIAIPSEITS